MMLVFLQSFFGAENSPLDLPLTDQSKYEQTLPLDKKTINKIHKFQMIAYINDCSLVRAKVTISETLHQ